MFTPATLFALQPEEAAPSPNPAEKVLSWAQDLDANFPHLEREAQRVEQLLETLAEPVSETGAGLMRALVEVFEMQLDGIYGLLEFHQSGDDEVLQQSLQQLLSSDACLQRLEFDLAEVGEAVPLLG